MKSFILLSLILGLVFQVTSTPSPVSTSLVSSQHNDRKRLTKRRWMFYSFRKAFSGKEDAVLIPPWYIVMNMIYNRNKTVGRQETIVYGVNGTVVDWGNYLKIKKYRWSENIPKSYAFLGMTSDINQQVKAYSSIPSSYWWQRTNYRSKFKGNVCYDFVISDINNKAADHELMLWLEWEGNQMPIGTGRPTRRIHDLYGQNWTVYQGTNTDINVQVTSILPDKQYTNRYFEGDMKLWLNKLIELRIFKEDGYISAANMGMEAFWGESLFRANSTLQLLWAGNNYTVGYIPPHWKPPAADTVVPGYEAPT
ncbi:hypothetical protein CROQUDRAFT_75392 [Cronartium quercuum f. sp. fusiforme G11]|uniref:Uncharacterized protein n=1 Tax=Cronartium quercuum f. sp. fusiforme G11 TaxID=708437 RepID=A0A9P6TE69_9BASI|nr:hypothetical protein CROQUDRAFT_75392 [Cronartium quercuum f. sp. fusiforme G11]